MTGNTFVMAKLDDFDKITDKEITDVVAANQEGLTALKTKVIEPGEEQLKGMTGYNKYKLPKVSPIDAPPIVLDSITFNLKSKVSPNIQYKEVFNGLMYFIKFNMHDWEEGIRKDNVRNHKGEQYIELQYLLSNYFFLYNDSSIANLIVKNEIPEKGIIPSADLEHETLEKLVINLDLVNNFHIKKPGSAKFWYQAKKFYDSELPKINAVKKEMENRTGVSKENMPVKMVEYSEQIKNFLYVVDSVPQVRKQYAKILERLFAVPQKDKSKGSKELPVIVNETNFIKLIIDYSPLVGTSLKTWKTLEGNVGELIAVLLGIEDEPRVAQEFPYLPEYKSNAIPVKNNRTFISVQGLYNRLYALAESKDYDKDKLARKHSLQPIF
jgi:hypothetical protein